jgi:hypothetical protein
MRHYEPWAVLACCLLFRHSHPHEQTTTSGSSREHIEWVHHESLTLAQTQQTHWVMRQILHTQGPSVSGEKL